MEEYSKASKELSKSVGRKVAIDYIPETIDLHEKIFEDRVRLKPESQGNNKRNL